MHKYDRRHLLAQAAAFSSLFYAERLLGRPLATRQTPSPLERLIIVYHPDGVFLEQWHGQQKSGAIDSLAESLLPLRPFVSQLLLFRNLSLLDGQGDGHDEAARCLLTGNRDPSQGSLDLHVAESLRLPLLHLGVLSSKAQGHSITFSPGGAEQIADDSPLAVYRRLFPDQLEAKLDPQVTAGVERELEVLIASVAQPREKLKLEQHLKQVRIALGTVNQCSGYDLSRFPYEEALKWEDTATPLILRMQIQNLVEALACGISRVATLQLSRHTSPLKMDFDYLKAGGAMESHQASHNNGMIHAQQKKWINQQLVQLFQLLEERPEPAAGRSGSMLDNSLVLVVTEIAQGSSHTRRDMPFYALGGAALGAYQAGRVLDCAGASHAQLLHSLSLALGVKPQGSYAGSGPLQGFLPT